MIITYIDMDGVLVDFASGACKAHGVDPADLYREQSDNYWQPGTWLLTKPLDVSLDEFWAPIHSKGSVFWETLEPTPWWEELIQIIERQSDDWYVVSAPSRHESSYVGKIRWLRRMFGPTFNQFIFTADKHLLARHEALLIDDRESNVADFLCAGGDALLFPAYCNKYHEHWQSPLQYLGLADQSLIPRFRV